MYILKDRNLLASDGQMWNPRGMSNPLQGLKLKTSYILLTVTFLASPFYHFGDDAK